MKDILIDLFWPNPVQLPYTHPLLSTLLGVCAAMVVLSFVVSFWRKRVENPRTRQLSCSWASALLWFGLVGLVMGVSCAEGISYLSMQFWWIVWVLCIALYGFFQVKQFRTKHYTIIPQVRVNDPRDRYLPKRKKR